MKARVRDAARVLTVSLCIVSAACTRDDSPRERAAPPAQQGARAVTGLQRLLAVAESTYYRGQHDSARAMWETATRTAVAAKDTGSQARALTWLGLTAWRQARYADARGLGEEALALKLRANLSADLSRSYNALGLLAHHQGRFGDAIALFTKAAEAARAVGDSAAEARALGNRGGLAYADIGEYDKAAQGLETMRRVFRALGDQRVEANALNNLGMLAVKSGDPVRAVASLQEALRLYRLIAYSAGEENALGQLGTAYQSMGDLQRALAYYDSALTLARTHGLRQQEADDLGLIAELLNDAGDRMRALEHLALAESLNRELGMLSEAGDIARAQARVYAAMGRLDLARERIAAARQMHDSAGAVVERLRDELLGAELSQRQGRASEATAALAAARRTAARLGHAPARAELALGEARVFDAAGDSRAVLRVVTRARADLPRLGADREWETDALESRARERLGQSLEAVRSGRRAVEKLERVRGTLAVASLRSSYTSDKSRPYADLVLILLRLGRVDEAFEVADAARGRALIEHISAAGRELRGRTPRGLAQADQLLRRIDKLVEQLRAADTTAPRERSSRSKDVDAEFGRLARTLDNTRREYERLMQRVGEMDPSAASVLGAAAANAASIRQSLRPNEALVEFFVTPDRLITFVITRRETRSFQSVIRDDDLGSRVRLARDLAASPTEGSGSRRATLTSLHETLIAPLDRAGALANAVTLIVVPHGSLAYLPFAALVNGTTGRALVEDYAVLVAPAASAIAALRSTPHLRSSSMVVLAPFPGQLPGTRDESRSIDRVMPSARSLVGARASEQAARAALESPAYVHFATHGILNVRNPMFSRIDLARASGERPPNDDGRLEVHELLNLRIRSPLVFLSGCETGAGAEWSTAFRRGEDYATLAQAFLFAGSRNVVATLWRIEDSGAAHFAAEFYKQLQAKDPIAALAGAQRAMLRHPRYSAPYYWAGYLMSGSGLL